MMPADSPATSRAAQSSPMYGVPTDVSPLDARIPLSSYLRDVVITFAVLALVLLVFVGPALFELHTPVPYDGDGLSHGLVVKTIIDAGWYPIHTRWVGAPFGADFLDYPFSDGLNFLLIWILSLFSGDWVVVTNLFFVGGFFLSAGTACVVLRRLGLASPWAIAGAVLFALLPYHLIRRGHILLASYFSVPIGVLLAVVAATGSTGEGSRIRRWLRLGVFSAIVGSAGVYYAFFSTFLVAVGGIARVLEARTWRAGLLAAGIVVAIACAVLVNLVPNLAYRAANGPNPEVAVRSPMESEVYGLRITQMLLPHRHHRIGMARALAERYAASAPMVNENRTATLGVVGSAGFLLLLLVALGRITGTAIGPPFVPLLSALGIAALLLGTIGGFGSVFAYVIAPMLRGYNRISLAIGFISLAVLLAILQAWTLRTRMVARSALAVVVATVVIVVGAFDQTPFEYPLATDPTFASDRTFVRELESRVPPDTAVLQLPYQPYPESAAVANMANYGPLRGYLNSTTLRWSYGAMKGRAGDQWLRALSSRPMPEMLDIAARSGFGAVYVDRRGFTDGGAAVETELRNVLGDPIAVSPDRLLVAYRLQSTGKEPLPLATLVPPIDAPIEFDKPNLSSAVRDISGFSGWEAWGRWTEGPVARIRFERPLPLRFTLKIDTTMAMPPNAGPDIVVRAGSAEQRFRVGTGATSVEIPMALAAPADTIELLIPAPTSPRELGMSEDPRKLGIGIRRMTILPTAEARR
jgi:phosphoglycerol transferase